MWIGQVSLSDARIGWKLWISQVWLGYIGQARLHQLSLVMLHRLG